MFSSSGSVAGLERQILVNVEPLEVRAAVIEDGALAELLIERPLSQRIAGNIYKGRVENILPGMEAAFVNIGFDRNAFLYVGDALNRPVPSEVEDDEPEDLELGPEPEAGELPAALRPRRPAIADILTVGQEIVVQVAKEAVGTKGPRITTSLSLPGRYVVLVPTMNYVGVSRRISAEGERARLRQIAEDLRPAGVGLIVRTVAEGRSAEEMARDVGFLYRLWQRIQERAQSGEAPCLLHRDLGLTFRVVRDLLNEDVLRVVVDSHHEYRRMQELAEVMSPDLRKRIRFWNGRGGPLFDAHKVEQEVEKLLRPRVWLRSGGYLVIDQSEALTTIDVNTGKFVGSTSLADTVLTTNLEASEEIARQIRLRDIAGIIVADFIDMEDVEHREQVINRLSEAVTRDRTKVHVLGFTQLGLLEITRKKVGGGLEAQLLKMCPTCDGRGRVLSEETMSQKVRREIKEILRKTQVESVLIEVNPAVAAVMIGSGGANLKELERETGRWIFIRGSQNLRPDAMNVVATGTRAEVERRARPVVPGEVIEVRVEEPHAVNQDDGIARVEGYVIDIEHGAARVGERVRVEIVGAYRTYAKARMLQTVMRRAVSEHQTPATPSAPA